MPARITINSVQLYPAPFVNTSATIAYRIANPAVAYTNAGAITIKPDGFLTAPKVISGLAPDTSYQIRIKLACGTVQEFRARTAKICPQISIGSIVVGPDSVSIGITPLISDTWCVEIYKDNIPDSGGTYIGTYCMPSIESDLIGHILIFDPNIRKLGTIYYARVTNSCSGQLAAPSDWVSYTPCLIQATVTFIVDGFDSYNLKVTLSQAAADNISFSVDLNRASDYNAPFTITVPAGSLNSGFIDTGVTADEVGDPAHPRILSSNPQVSGDCFIKI